MKDLYDVPLEQFLVLADTLYEEDPEAHVGKTVLAQIATLLSRDVCAVEYLERRIKGLRIVETLFRENSFFIIED